MGGSVIQVKRSQRDWFIQVKKNIRAKSDIPLSEPTTPGSPDIDTHRHHGDPTRLDHAHDPVPRSASCLSFARILGIEGGTLDTTLKRPCC